MEPKKGRPPLPATEVRSHAITVKVTETAWEALAVRAGAEGLRVTDVVRALIMEAVADWEVGPVGKVPTSISATPADTNAQVVPSMQPAVTAPDGSTVLTHEPVRHHLHSPGTVLSEEFQGGVRYVTNACSICGVALLPRRA
jgi:hypothetical protein